MRTGVISGISASFGSGIAAISINDYESGPEVLYADNGMLMRSLDAAFPGFITEGHTVDPSVVEGEVIEYVSDGIGMLDGFQPI